MGSFTNRSNQILNGSRLPLDAKFAVGGSSDFVDIDELIHDAEVQESLYPGALVVDITNSRLYKLDGSVDNWTYDFLDNRRVYSGSLGGQLEPNSSVGIEDDLFLDTDTGDFWIKEASVWTSLLDLSALVGTYASSVTVASASATQIEVAGGPAYTIGLPTALVAPGSLTVTTSLTANSLLVTNGISGTGGATLSGAAINLNHDSNYAVNIGTGTSSGQVSIGTGGASQTVTVGYNASYPKIVTVGSKISNSSLSLYAGTGNFLLEGGVTTTYTIGSTTQTGLITIDRSTKSHTLELGIGATEAGLTKTINVGTAGVNTSTTNITLGSSVSGAAGTTTINSATLTDIKSATLTAGEATTVNLGTTGVTARSINVATAATGGASTLTFGGAVTGNVVKIASIAAGTINLTTDVTSGTANIFPSITGKVYLGGANCDLEVGDNTALSTSTITIGGATASSLKALSTTGNLYDDTCTTINLGTTAGTSVNIGKNHGDTVITLNGTKAQTGTTGGVVTKGGMYVAEKIKAGGMIESASFARAGVAASFSGGASTMTINLSNGNTAYYYNPLGTSVPTLTIAMHADNDTAAELYNYIGGSFIISIYNDSATTMAVKINNSQAIFDGFATGAAETVASLTTGTGLTYSGIILPTSGSTAKLFGIVSPISQNLMI